jgi:hypothetical protein
MKGSKPRLGRSVANSIHARDTTRVVEKEKDHGTDKQLMAPDFLKKNTHSRVGIPA